MDEKKHHSRPPSAPKPSRTNHHGIERRRQLKDRLKLRWNQPQPLYAAARIDPSLAVKGYGEIQFADSQYEGDRIDLEHGGSESLWADSTVFPGDGAAAIGSDNRHLAEPFQRVREISRILSDQRNKQQNQQKQPLNQTLADGLNQQLAGSVASYHLTHQSIHRSTLLTHSLAEPSTTSAMLSSQPAVMGITKSSMEAPEEDRDETSRRAVVPYSHLEVSRSLAQKGVEGVAESLVLGETGFCYVENTAGDFYSFGIRSDVPDGLSENRYMTMSQFGILRSQPGEGELISFADLERERELYHRLIQLSVFKYYRLWKPFLLWRKHVRGKKFLLVKNELEERLLTTHDFNRKLLLNARIRCLSMESLSIFCLDHRDFSKSAMTNNTVDFQTFIALQKANNEVVKAKVGKIREDLVDQLTRECEGFICEAAQSTPAALSHEKYQAIKLTYVNNYQEIVQAAEDNHNLLQSAMHSDTPPPPADLGEGDASMSSPREGKVQAVIENTLDSMSTVSHYIYNTTNLGAMASNIYNVKYTQELLDDQSIISSYASSPVNAIGSGSSVAARRRNIEEMKKSQRKATRNPNEGVDTGDHVNPAAAATPTHVSYSVRAAIRLVCRKIYHVYRIVDYMMRDLLYDKLKGELDLLIQLLSSSFDHYADQLQANGAISTGYDKAFPIIEEEPSSVNLFTKKDTVRNMKSKLVTLFFRIALTISEFDYSNPSNTNNNKGAHSPTVTIASTLRDIEGNKLLIKEENIDKVALLLHPNMENCIDEFLNLLRDTCQTCVYTEGLLQNKKCLDILRPVLNEIAVFSMEDRVLVDADQGSEVQTLINNCTLCLHKSFSIITSFVNYLQVYKREFTQNISKLVLLDKNKLTNVPSEDILQDYSLWDQRLLSYSSLFVLYNIGVFYIDLSKLKLNLVDNVNHCVAVYNKQLPELLLTHGDSLYKDISRYIDRLGRSYNSLDDYIKNVEVFNLLNKKQDEITDSYNYLLRLKEIVDLRSIKISDEILRQSALLGNLYTKLNLLIVSFGDAFEGQVKLFRSEIQNRLKNIIVPIQELQDYLFRLNAEVQELYGKTDHDENDHVWLRKLLFDGHSKFSEKKEEELLSQEPQTQLDAPSASSVPHLNIEKAISDLLRYKSAIMLISSQLQTLDYYQQLLGISVFEYGLQLEIQKELNATILLLNNFVIVRELYSNLLATNYVDINFASAMKEVHGIKTELEDSDYFMALKDILQSRHEIAATQGKEKDNELASTVHHLQHGTSDDLTTQHAISNHGIFSVYKMIFNIIHDVEVYMSIISMLQSKALTAKHQIKINYLLQYNVFDVSINNTTSATVTTQWHQESDYTLAKLIDTVNVPRYWPELSIIHHEAMVTFNLKNKIELLVQQLLGLELVFSTELETTNKSQVYLTNYHTLLEDLADLDVSFTSLSNSSHGAILLAEQYPELLQQVKEDRLYLTYFQSIQSAYNKYKQLFVSARSARHLSAYMKNYKIVDDGYRNLVKAARSDMHLHAFIHSDKNTMGLLEQCLEHVNSIEKGFKRILRDFCEKYPKLYLIHDNVFYQSFLLTSLKDVVMLLTPYLFQSMNITQVEFDGNDDSNVLAVTSSYLEKVSFHKTCSARNNLYDFFKLMDMCIHDKLERDIKELIVTYLDEEKALSLVDEIKNNHHKYSSQALLLIFQIQFWNNFWKQFTASSTSTAASTAAAMAPAMKSGGGYSRSVQSRLKSFMLELQDSINILYTIYTEPVSQYGIQLTSDFIITLLYYRDLLKEVLAEYNLSWDHELNAQKEISKVIQGISLVFCNIQKYVENYYPYNVNCYNLSVAAAGGGALGGGGLAQANSSAAAILHNIYLSIGGEKVKYGLKYNGYNQRLAIHPVVDKFYFAMMQTFSSHSVAYLTNPINTTSTHSVGSVDLLQSLSMELGQEQFFYHLRDLSLYTHNSLLFQEVENIQYNNASGTKGRGVVGGDEEEGGRCYSSNISQFNRLVRAAMKSGLWVTLINNDRYHEDPQDHEMATTLLSYISSVLSVIYQELHSRNKQYYQPDYLNNIREYQNGYNKVMIKHELFGSGGLSVDHGVLNQMKFVVMNSHLPSATLFACQVFPSSHLFRPLTIPTVNLKIVLNILLSSFNFIYINKLSERLDQLVSFLIHHNYANYHLLKYLLIQTVRSIGNHGDHLVVNVSTQLTLIIKKFLNNLPSTILQRLQGTGDIKLIYNLFLELVYDPAKDGKDLYINTYYCPTMTYEEELVARLWDCTSNAGYGTQNQSNAQLHNNTVNQNIFHNDIQAIATYNRPPQTPESYSAAIANASSAAAIAATTIYKRSILVLGNAGVGKTELVFRALNTMKTKYNQEDKSNIRILPYVLNPLLIAGDVDEVVSKREENDPPPVPLVPTVEKNMIPLQQYIQNFLNMDHTQQITMNIIYFDVTSYRESFQMMHEIIQYVNIFYRLHRVKLIFESVNISDMDPYFITQFDILHISKPIFTVEELLEKHLVQCLESESSIFRRVVEESFHALIKPTILFVLSEISSHQQAMAALYIIPQMFTLLTTLYHHYVFPLASFGFGMPNLAAAVPQNNASKSTSSTMMAHKNSSLLHNSFMGNLPRNFVMVNKPYKLPNISFDEDSLRRLVLYGLLWTCGSCSATFYLGANSLEDHQKRLEHFIRHRLPNTVESFPYKKVIPSHEQVSLFDQFLCPRIQSEGRGINTTSSAAVNAGMNATPVLEWTVIDEKYISSALQKKPIVSHGAAGRGGGSQHSLNDAVLFSNLSWSYHQTNQIYVPNPLSLNLSYIQSSYALILPIHFQSTVQNQVNPLFRHNYNNLYNIFGCRGMLISGEVGSGRRSLLRQLLADLVETKVSVSNRWLAHTSLQYSDNDRSHVGSSLSSFILEAQQSLAQKRYEQNVLNIGAIFIEDVNLDLFYQNHRETNALRHLLQFNTVFDSSKQQYRVYNSFYVAAMTQRSSGRQVRAEDHRLSRLFHNVQISPSNIVNVLTHYFERQLGMLHQDICFDLTHVLYSFLRDLQDVVLFIEMKRKDLTFRVGQCSVPIVSLPVSGTAPPGASANLTGSSEASSREGVILKMFEAIIDRQPTILDHSMDLFYPLLVCPASVQSKEIIDHMILALHTFHNVTNEVDQATMASVGVLDFLAVFDRILCDHINRLIQIPHLYDVYNTVLDYTINHSVPVYRYNNMLGLLEKLRVSRVANYDSILSNPSNHMTAWEPLSYTRCVGGFYKTGSNILPILLTAEFVRDTVLKKVSSKMIALISENDFGHGINLQILTDFKFRDHAAMFIPSTAAFTDNNSSLSASVLLLLAAVYEYGKIYRNDQSFWHDILRMMTVWTSSYPCSYFLVRSPCLIYNSIGNDGQVKNVVHRSDFIEHVYPRVLLAMQYFHHASYEVIDLPCGSAPKQASTPQQGKQDGIDFQYANFANCVKKICHFLQDDFVLYGIYCHVQALALGEVKTLITKEVINFLSIVLSHEEMETLKAVENKYRLIPQNLSYYEKKAAGATTMSQVGHKIHSLSDVTVWCVHFNSTNSSWQNYLEDLSFQSAYMIALLSAINPRLNAQLYQEMNDIILHYNHRQKVLLLDENPQEAESLSAVCTVSSSGRIPQTTSSAITQQSSSFFYTIYEYPLYSDYSIMDELLERFLIGFILAQRALPQQSQSPEVALGASVRDKEEQDKEDREHLHALLSIVDDFVSLCTEEVVVHYSYPTTVLGEKTSKTHQEEPENPFDYIRNELKMILLQQIQKFVLRYHKLCLEDVKKGILGMMNKYVMYNFQPAFFQAFVSSLQPVDLLCLLVFSTFYHSILPARYLHLPVLRHHHNLTKIQHFLITHLPSFHPLEDDVLPINEKKTGLALEEVLESLDGLNIIFNLAYPAFESCLSNLLSSYMHATMAMVYTIPSSRMCKSHLLAVHHAVCTSARIRLEDRTLLGSLLIAKLLRLESAENDGNHPQIHFHANCLVSTFPCVGSTAPFDKSGGEMVVQVLLSQYEYLADYLLLLLLERNMLGPVASELQSLYLHRKEDFRQHLFSPVHAMEVIGGGLKISASSGLGRLNASSINHTKHMSERFNGLYSEMVHKILQPMENLMLVFTNVMAIYQKQGEHNEEEALRILQGLFDELLISLTDYLTMTKAGSSAKESLTYSLEEILSLATWKLLDGTLPNILPSPASMNTVLMNIVMDYVFLDYHEPDYANSKFLLEQRCQLLQLIKDLYHLENGGGRSDKDESNSRNYDHSRLDKKFGIILLHKDEIKAEAAAERKEEEDSPSGLPSSTTPRKRRKSRFFRGMPSFDERDDRSDESDSQSDGDSSDSLTDEDSQEDEVFLLANHSRRVFHQMLLMVAHLFTTTSSSINNFYLKYIHKSKASANVSSCLAILDDMHDEIDIYVDFSEQIYSPNLVFPNASGYSLTILDKFLLCLVVKVNVVGAFCRDVIVRHGSGLDISQGKYRHFISPDKNKDSNLDQVNVLPPMMDPVAAAAATAAAASSSPPRLSRMSILANQQSDVKQEEVIRLQNIRSATDLLYQLHVHHTNHKPFPPGPAAFPSPPPLPSHFNIYLCRGHVNLSIIMDYILQNNREIMLANVAAGWVVMNDGSPSLSRMGSRTASMRKMSISYPGEEEPPSPAVSPSPPMGKMLRTSSMLGRGQSFMGAVGNIANSNSLGAIYSRHITTLFYDNSNEMKAENWVDHLIRYIVNMKTVFDVHPILYVVCLKEISPSQHHWQSLKQFVVKERMNIIISSPQMTIQEVKMNSCQGLDLSLISRTRNSSMDLSQSGPSLTRRSFFGRRSMSTSRDAEDSLNEEKGKMISSLGQANGEGAEAVNEKGLRPSLFFSYHTSPPLHFIHLFDGPRVADRIAYYVHMMSQLTYLIDTNTTNKLIICWPTQIPASQQQELIRISKWVINRVRWLLVFLHIALVYNFEVARYAGDDLERMNDNLLFHANQTIEKLWLNTLNAVLVERYANEENAENDPNHLVAASSESSSAPATNGNTASIYRKRIGGGPPFSSDCVVDEIICQCYERFDEIALHHVLLLLIYYPFLHGSLVHHSIMDELQVKYIFENIFTSRSAVYTSSYYVLNQVLLPREINIYKHKDVAQFCATLTRLLSKSDNEDSSDAEESNSDDDDKGGASTATDSGMLLLDLLFVTLPQTSTKTVYLLQTDHTFPNYPGVVDLVSTQQLPIPTAHGAPVSSSVCPVEDRMVELGSCLAGRLQDMVLLHLEHILRHLLNSLSPLIDLENDPEIQENAEKFRLKKDLEQMKGRNTMVVIPGSHGSHAGGGPASLHTIRSRRKGGQRMLLQFQARDYDSLWMHMLAEASSYNAQLKVVRQHLQQLQWACRSRSHLACFFSALHKHHLSVEFMMEDMMKKLPMNQVPAFLLAYEDGVMRALPVVTIDQYLQLWRDRHQQLLHYLHNGNLNNVKLHLFHNLLGLFFALKESFAMKTESSIDKVFLHYDLCSLSQHNKFIHSNQAAINSVHRVADAKENFGCNVRAVDLALFQARIGGPGAHSKTYTSGNNSASLRLEFLPPCSQASFGSEVVLHIFPSLVEQSMSNECYLCPLFVSAFPALPSLFPTESEEGSPNWKDNRQQQATCWVPINTVEDTVECALSRIALYSKPSFIIPV